LGGSRDRIFIATCTGGYCRRTGAAISRQIKQALASALVTLAHLRWLAGCVPGFARPHANTRGLFNPGYALSFAETVGVGIRSDRKFKLATRRVK